MTTPDAILALRDALLQLVVAGTFLMLAIIPLGLTVAMFLSRNMMLGFAAALFWAIFGAYAYGQSTTAWGDWQFYLAFASLFGMVIFDIYAAFALREKPGKGDDEFLDEGEDTTKYIDEDPGDSIEKAFYGDEDERGNLEEDEKEGTARRPKRKPQHGEFT